MCKENCDKCVEDKGCCNGVYRPLEDHKRLITYRVWYFDRHMCSKFANVTASDEYVARKIFRQYHPGCIVRRLYISKYQGDCGGVSNVL